MPLTLLTKVLLVIENARAGSETSSTISSELVADGAEDSSSNNGSEKLQMKLLDLYSGCGAMSTGLCHGVNLAGVNLITVTVKFLPVLSLNFVVFIFNLLLTLANVEVGC